MKRIRVVAAVIREQDKVFANARGYGEFKGQWEFPGGKIEEGETPQQALAREIKEELNVNIEVGELIDTFLKWREKQGMCCVPESKLFLDKKGLDMHIDTVRGAFERIREHAGISRSDKSPFQPRLHDLRHTFAVHRLTSWYRENQDVQQLLPVLSTYLGHTHLSHTSVYLTMTDGLLGEANNRFESYIKQGKDE